MAKAAPTEFIDGTTEDFDSFPVGLGLVFINDPDSHTKLTDYTLLRWKGGRSAGLINCDEALLDFTEFTTMIRLSAKNQDVGGFLGVTKFEKVSQGTRPASKLKQLHETAVTAGVSIVITLTPLPGDRIPSWAAGVAAKVVRMRETP